MKTIVNISASTILHALRNAKPLTAVGRAAVENFRGWMVNNTMSAIALESALTDLTGKSYDPGLENLVSVLKGIMPESKRKVAAAYEAMQLQQVGTVFSPNQAAFEALISLYNDNAAKIIGKINDGALNAFKTNPIIGNLIAWAKAAVQANDSGSQQAVLVNAGSGDIKFTLVPVLNLASVDDNMLVAIDRRTYLLAKSGKLTLVPDITAVTELPSDVKQLMYVLGAMHASSAEANILLFDDGIVDIIRKAMPVQRIGINLIGGIDSMVVINNDYMSVDKAKALLATSNDDLVAAMLTGGNMPDAIRILTTAFDVFERYRGILNSNLYANKFSFNDDAVYLLESGTRIAVVSVINGSVTDVSSYNTMFDVLTSDTFVSNPPLYDLVSTTFADELKADAKKISVRKQIATKLANERKEYESLLSRIDSELDSLEQTVDANPDKVAALKALKDKTATQIATIAEELDKLAKA